MMLHTWVPEESCTELYPGIEDIGPSEPVRPPKPKFDGRIYYEILLLGYKNSTLLLTDGWLTMSTFARKNCLRCPPT
jgi:hypothetical protein